MKLKTVKGDELFISFNYMRQECNLNVARLKFIDVDFFEKFSIKSVKYFSSYTRYI